MLSTTSTIAQHSASDIAVYGDKLYVIGDDSNYVLELPSGNKLKLTADPPSGERIPKMEKPDWEACCVVGDELWIFGSASLPHRSKMIALDLNTHTIADKSDFYQSILDQILRSDAPPVLNIEAVCASAKGELLIANRADNMLYEFIHDGNQPKLNGKWQLMAAGRVSGMCSREGALYISTSEENTGNAIDDGEIGDSRIYAFNWQGNLKTSSFVQREVWNLDAVKVEGIAILNNELLCVTDHDQVGDSLLITMQL